MNYRRQFRIGYVSPRTSTDARDGWTPGSGPGISLSHYRSLREIRGRSINISITPSPVPRCGIGTFWPRFHYIPSQYDQLRHHESTLVCSWMWTSPRAWYRTSQSFKPWPSLSSGRRRYVSKLDANSKDPMNIQKFSATCPPEKRNYRQFAELFRNGGPRCSTITRVFCFCFIVD